MQLKLAQLARRSASPARAMADEHRGDRRQPLRPARAGEPVQGGVRRTAAAGGAGLGRWRDPRGQHGLGALEPRAVEGGARSRRAGRRLSARAAWPRKASLIGGGRRYVARAARLGGGPLVVELTPAGDHIADDDLDAFVTALAGGQTGFRFDDGRMQHRRRCRRWATASSSFDRRRAGARPAAARRGGRRAAAAAPMPASRRRCASSATTSSAIIDERDEQLAAREQLEAKMEAVLRAIDRYRAASQRLPNSPTRAAAGPERRAAARSARAATRRRRCGR